MHITTPYFHITLFLVLHFYCLAHFPFHFGFFSLPFSVFYLYLSRTSHFFFCFSPDLNLGSRQQNKLILFLFYFFFLISQCLFLVLFLLGANWSKSLLLCWASLSLLFFSLRFHEIFSYSQLYTWIFWSFTASARTNIIAANATRI